MCTILVVIYSLFLLGCPAPLDVSSATTYSVSYDGNGNTSGTVPVDSHKYKQADTVTILANSGSLLKSSYTFAGWNTKADGTGTSYPGGVSFAMGTANVTLYAVWTQNPTYTVTYVANATLASGSVPTDNNHYLQGVPVTVLGNTGNMVVTGDTFTGWNTQPNGSGTNYAPGATFTMGTSNVTLYTTWVKRFLYVANYWSCDVSAFSVGSDGALSQLSGSPFAAAPSGYPYSIAVSPNSSFLYVANSNTSNISAYSIGSNGALTQLAGSPFAAGSGPEGVVVSPNGSFLYVADSGVGKVSGYSINADGTLTPLSGSPFAAGPYPSGIAISPNGSFLYVTNSGSKAVAGFSIGSDGALTQLSGSPFTAGSGAVASAAVVSPNGSFLYLASLTNSKVYAFSIDSGGGLGQLSSSPFALAGQDYGGIAVTPNGSFLYATNYPGTHGLTAFSIGSDGALTQLSGSPYTITGAWGDAISPDGSFLYVAVYGSGRVGAYSIGSDGALTQVTGSQFTAGTYPIGLAVATLKGP
ncbi:MAG: beta-propeller fold lactonase family protein [Spirochaetia bacterium]